MTRRKPEIDDEVGEKAAILTASAAAGALGYIAGHRIQSFVVDYKPWWQTIGEGVRERLRL